MENSNLPKKPSAYVMATALASVMLLTGCGNNGSQTSPVEKECSDDGWFFDNDNDAWQCQDTRSSYNGHYFFGGSYYSSSDSLRKSDKYIAYKQSPASSNPTEKAVVNPKPTQTITKGVSSGSFSAPKSGLGSSSSSSGG